MKISLPLPGSSKSSLLFGRLRKHSLPYILIVPAVLSLILFSLYPFISGIWYSFTSIGWITDIAKFIGLSNYQQILVGGVGIAQFFGRAVVQTIYWTAIGVAGQFVLAMATALILNEKFPGRFLFRTAVLVSIAMPTVVLALTWQWMYDPFYGLVNHYLKLLGVIHNANTIWVGSTNSTIWPLIVVSIWRGFPFMSLMLLSGMQGISQELYEAAKVDGANVVARFWHITLTQMRTTIMITLVLNTIWTWNSFDIVMVVGSSWGVVASKALTLPLLAWIDSFRWSHLGRGAAISVMSMVLILGMLFWSARRELRSVTE
jgi:multiple sugar transport system permease protein